MSQRVIELTVDNEYIQGDGTQIGAAGSHDDVILRTAFGSAWDGLTKTVIFKDSYGDNAVTVLLTADLLEAGETNIYRIPVPAAPKAYPGDMYMTIKGVRVSGTNEAVAALTAFASFKVLRSMYDGEEIEDVPASMADQLQAQIDDVLVDIANIQTHAADAEAWANGTRDGVPIEEGDVAYGKDAKGSAEAAAESAANAATSEANALASEQAAAESESNAASSEENARSAQSAAASSASSAAGSAASALSSKNAAEAAQNYAAASQTAIAEDRAMVEQALTGFSSPLVYKGSVSTASLLPATGNAAGDCYIVQESGTTYAWNGSSWNQLSLSIVDGGTF